MKRHPDRFARTIVVAVAALAVAAAMRLTDNGRERPALQSGTSHQATKEPPTDTQANSAQPLLVQATGRNFQWHFRYRSSSGTAFDAAGDLYVPTSNKVRLELTSDDYIYLFRLPESGQSEIAVPEMTHTLEFRADKIGEYEILVDPLCGYLPLHDDAMGRLHVVTPVRFEQWLKSRRGGQPEDPTRNRGGPGTMIEDVPIQ